MKLLVLLLLLIPASASAADSSLVAPVLGPERIFSLLFLMLGPMKVLAPFVAMTRDLDGAARRRHATHAILYAAAAIILAGGLGSTILDRFAIPLNVVALTGGLLLFLTALDAILRQFSQDDHVKAVPSAVHPARLAFPTIATPYGVAAVIVFCVFAKDDTGLMVSIAAMTALILFIDWLAMLVAERFLKHGAPALEVLAVVFGVVQVSLGLQLVLRSLNTLGILHLPV